MKVYCYGCKTSFETDWLIRCPHCETKDIGIEPDRAWHTLCCLFAHSKGWSVGSEFSLPQWFQREPEHLKEWKAFKAKLMDMEAVKLPADYKLTHPKDFYDYWLLHSGLLIPSLFGGTKDDLITTPLIGPLVHQLATSWADHHQRRKRVEGLINKIPNDLIQKLGGKTL